MSWKHYVGGAATGLGLAGFIYFAANSGNIRGEKVIHSNKIDDFTLKIIETDKKFAIDDYRIEIIDKEGKLRAKIYGNEPNGHRIDKAYIKTNDGTEFNLDF